MPESARQSAPHRAFDPESHAESLEAILRAIDALPGDPGAPVERPALDAILRRHPRGGKGFFSRAQLIAGYRHFAERWGLAQSPELFARRLQRRPVRSQSGVTPITVLTKPFPCPGRCVFCPNDVRMPKSYLSDEPGAQRAAANRFDPYLQTWNRLAALRAIGHPTDKVELIVLGGTWSFYPEPYQVWFATRCFQAMNDFGAEKDERESVRIASPDFETLSQEVVGPGAPAHSYNRAVQRFLSAELGGALVDESECATWSELETAQAANEAGSCRNVGFVVETRPDCVNAEEVERIRRLGCTKVQIGIQSLSDRVLEQNQRGHDVATTRRAMGLLRGAGFKIHAHWMPNLLGSTPEKDVREFAGLFADPALRPDELKVYPCSLIETAELMQFYERGEWRPYDFEELVEVLCAVLEGTPRYCRLTRVIRDISSDDIVVGNKRTNFREIVEKRFAESGGCSRDIRAREIRGAEFARADLTLRETRYATAVGEERFFEFVTPDDRITAFLRLLLPVRNTGFDPIDEVSGSALIREVHVYGPALDIGASSEGEAQHRGLGQDLVARAVEAARDEGYRDLAVISAVGTRGYYRKLGFENGRLYQHFDLGL